MNTQKITSAIKSGSVSTIKAIVAPIHIGLYLSTNIVAAIEGHAIELIDGTPKDQTIEDRFMYTNMKMMQAAVKAGQIRDSLQQKVDQSRQSLQQTVDTIKREYIQPAEDPSNDIVEFRVTTLRAQRDKIIADNPELSPNNQADIRRINQAINKAKKGITPVTPQVAFN